MDKISLIIEDALSISVALDEAVNELANADHFRRRGNHWKEIASSLYLKLEEHNLLTKDLCNLFSWVSENYE